MSKSAVALRQGLGSALTTAAAMSLAVGATALFAPQPGPLVLAAVLAMTLSRSHLLDSWRGRLESVAALPVVTVAVAGVALSFVKLPWLGAALFTVAMAASIWLRRFGTLGRRLGSLVALPFITLLITPRVGPAASIGTVIVVSLVALAAAVACRLLAQAVGLGPRREPTVASEEPSRASTLRPVPSTRMAVQLGLALAAAFVVGFLFVPEHWSWVVLTAYLVNSGNRGRADVLNKSGLRVLGAAAGSLVAIPLATLATLSHPLLSGAPLVVFLLVVMAVGLVLRSASYAFWALTMTLVVTVLQGVAGAGEIELVPRILAILAGAACGVLASWFVLPIRSENVLRRRIADTLAALQPQLADPSDPNRAAVSGALARVDEVAPPFRALARVPVERLRRDGEWITTLHAVVGLGSEGGSPAARRTLGAARGAVRQPAELLPALRALLRELDGN